MEFIERVKQALYKQVEDPKTQWDVLQSLALENANKDCHHVLKALPRDPKPTIEQMVEACTEVTPVRTAYATPARLPPQRTTATVTTTTALQGPADARTCFNCGSPFHFTKLCKVTPSMPKSVAGLGLSPCPCLQQHLGNGQ